MDHLGAAMIADRASSKRQPEGDHRGSRWSMTPSLV